MARDERHAGQAADSGAKYHVRALERALSILDVFSLETPEWSLTDLTERVGLAKSTVIRLLAVLESGGLVERLEQTDRYRLGVRVFELGSIYIQTTSIETEAQPFLQNLARGCFQTASLAVLDRGQIIHIAVVEPDRPLRFSWPAGQREPLHCTGLGKALVLDRTREELSDLLADAGLPARTDHTITDLDALWRNLQEGCRRGYVVDDEESFIGLRCVAAPVRNAHNAIVAAVSISGPRTEIGVNTLPEFGAMVMAAARGISARIGQRIHEIPGVDATPVTVMLDPPAAGPAIVPRGKNEENVVTETAG